MSIHLPNPAEKGLGLLGRSRQSPGNSPSTFLACQSEEVDPNEKKQNSQPLDDEDKTPGARGKRVLPLSHGAPLAVGLLTGTRSCRKRSHSEREKVLDSRLPHELQWISTDRSPRRNGWTRSLFKMSRLI